jgi:hypothetical protein
MDLVRSRSQMRIQSKTRLDLLLISNPSSSSKIPATPPLKHRTYSLLLLTITLTDQGVEARYLQAFFQHPGEGGVAVGNMMLFGHQGAKTRGLAFLGCKLKSLRETREKSKKSAVDKNSSCGQPVPFLMTRPRSSRSELIFLASLNRSPAAPVILADSEPARSTRFSFLSHTVFIVHWYERTNSSMFLLFLLIPARKNVGFFDASTVIAIFKHF